jgi:hypothetical protein
MHNSTTKYTSPVRIVDRVQLLQLLALIFVVVVCLFYFDFVFTCCLLSCHVMSCHIMSYHVISCSPASTTGSQALKIALDWWLLSMADRMVALGSIQSTFSASAWHLSLRPEQMHHVSNKGRCMIGGSGMFELATSFHRDDPALQGVYAAWKRAGSPVDTDRES